MVTANCAARRAVTANVRRHTEPTGSVPDNGVMEARTDTRHHQRRTDRATAERVDLAALTARAFDLHAAKNYLRLSGVSSYLIASFAERYPHLLRAAEPERVDERRRPAANS
jgi:hypothetical protein